MDVDCEFLTGGVRYAAPVCAAAVVPEADDDARSAVSTALPAEARSLLSLLRACSRIATSCSRASIYRRYDGVVRGAPRSRRASRMPASSFPIPGAPLAVALGRRRQSAVRQARSAHGRRARRAGSDAQRHGGRRDAGRTDRLPELRRSDGPRADGRVRRCRRRFGGRRARARRAVRLRQRVALQSLVVGQSRRAVADRRVRRRARRRVPQHDGTVASARARRCAFVGNAPMRQRVGGSVSGGRAGLASRALPAARLRRVR